MPTYLSPGVYVEETEAGTRPPTDVAALVVGGSPVSAPESGPAPVRVAPADPPRVVQRAPVRGLTGARALVPQLTSPAPIEPARTGRRTGSRPVRVQRPTWAPPSSSTSRSGRDRAAAPRRRFPSSRPPCAAGRARPHLSATGIPSSGTGRGASPARRATQAGQHTHCRPLGPARHPDPGSGRDRARPRGFRSPSRTGGSGAAADGCESEAGRGPAPACGEAQHRPPRAAHKPRPRLPPAGSPESGTNRRIPRHLRQFFRERRAILSR